MIDEKRRTLLLEQWKQEEQAGFQGWDFSSLENRLDMSPLPWNYEAMVREHLSPGLRLLDMGTGGGEFLLTLEHPYQNTVVTEAWPPNIKLCQERLSPLGVTVVPVEDDDRLPLADDLFDLVINRHEAYGVGEVRRILKDGGLFITQQVGTTNNEPLISWLLPGTVSLYPDSTLETRVRHLVEAGFTVECQQEFFAPVRYFDVGAIIYSAKIMEWEFPGFSVDRCFGRLLEMQEKIDTQGYVESLEHRFVIVARNRP